MRLVALLLRALDAEKPNICPAFSTGRCCPCVRARASRPQGGQCHLEGLDVGGKGREGGAGVKATGRAVGEVTVQTVHLSLRKSHSRCSNCKCHRNRLKKTNKQKKKTYTGWANYVICVQNPSPANYPRTHTRTADLLVGINRLGLPWMARLLAELGPSETCCLHDISHTRRDSLL